MAAFPAHDAERRERAEGYLAAAREHYRFLSDLPPEPEHHPLAYYVAGLAVECLFRGYTELVGGAHDPGHDLRRLAESGRFLEFVPEALRDEVCTHLGEVRTRWLNNPPVPLPGFAQAISERGTALPLQSGSFCQRERGEA